MQLAEVTFKQLTNEPFTLGALGGLMVALISLFSNLNELHDADDPKLRGALFSFFVTAVILGCMGGLVSWVTDGRAGYFLTGATALALGIGLLPDGAET